MASDLLQRVVDAVPVGLHRHFKANANEAALNLGVIAKKHNYTHQQSGMVWYAEVEHAYRAAAISAGLTSAHNTTVPPGGSFTTINVGGILVGRFSGPMPMATPKRRAKYMRALTAANAAIDTQGALFAPNVNYLLPYASYLSVIDYKSYTCAHIGFGFLSPCRTRWIEYWSIETLVAAYAPTEQISDHAGSQIPDKVKITLKNNDKQ